MFEYNSVFDLYNNRVLEKKKYFLKKKKYITVYSILMPSSETVRSNQWSRIFIGRLMSLCAVTANVQSLLDITWLCLCAVRTVVIQNLRELARSRGVQIRKDAGGPL
jgi:hypothetical protein